MTDASNEPVAADAADAPEPVSDPAAAAGARPAGDGDRLYFRQLLCGRDIAATDAYVTSRRERKKVEMLFAHLKRILKLDRLRLRGPCGARDEFLLAATAQNLRKMAKLMPTRAQPWPA